MWKSVPQDRRVADGGWAMGRHVVRVVMTLIGTGVLLIAAFMDWTRGIGGDRLSFEAFVRTGAPSVSTFWRSAAMVMLVVALIGLLGLATTKGGLTRLGGALAIAAVALLAIQLARAGDLTSQLDDGPWLALAGGVVLVLGGMPSTRRDVRQRRRVRRQAGGPARPDVAETDAP
jgi:hypothetical protein